jgi:hypothetical protein
MRTRLVSVLHLVTLVALATPILAAEQRKFARPEEALTALLDASRAGDQAQVLAILGPGGEDVISSGDPVEDRNARDRVLTAAKHGTRLETLPGGDVIVHEGPEDSCRTATSGASTPRTGCKRS